MHHLSTADVSFVLDERVGGNPEVLHWGAALPDEALDALAATASGSRMHSSPDVPIGPSVAASQADTWSGTPAFEWTADGTVPGRLNAEVVPADGALEVRLTDERTDGVVRLRYRLHPSGVLEASAELEARSRTLDVVALRILLPIPDSAREVLDFTGAWSDERRPQRHELADGTWLRSARTGRTGHDAATLTVVGTPGFRHRSGEVWATHLGWSGDGQTLVERSSRGAGVRGSMLGAGELLAPGEVRLAPGERYAGPSTWFIWSDRGTDGLTSRIHSLVRTFAAHPRGPRPLVLNSWEAVYFDQDLERLRPLVEVSADLGVERFVLDDGWFLGRRDDSAGLGDWTVDPAVWPRGLGPLSELVHGRGMQFGLWFEPEMVSPGSELARDHPEWILADNAGSQPLARQQQVLNIGIEACWQHVFEAVSAVVTEASVDFIKWDHNRDLHEPVDRITGRVGVHWQTLGFYRMVDALLERHPGLEIESCASGGGRIDVGVLQHAQRVWASDTIDPVERQRIQLGTEAIVPLELMGAHVGAARAHTTGRVTSLAFRMATALFGHAGVEWDVAALGDDERTALARWAALYKEQRHLLHTGELVHGDVVPDGAILRGVVDVSRKQGLFQLAQIETGRRAADPRTPLPGLDPSLHYKVRFREEFGRAARRTISDPSWCAALSDGQSTVIPGTLLVGPGVPLPALQPAEALIIQVDAV